MHGWIPCSIKVQLNIHRRMARPKGSIRYLPILEFAYNSSKHVTIGFSPFMLMYGFQPRSPVTVGLANEKIQQVKDFLQDHMDMLRVSRQNVRQAQDLSRPDQFQNCRPDFVDHSRFSIMWATLPTSLIFRSLLGFILFFSCKPFKEVSLQ